MSSPTSMNSSVFPTPSNNEPDDDPPALQRRRKHSDVFMNGLKSVSVGTFVRAKCNRHMSSRLWQQWSDQALQHLIAISGYGKIEKI